MAKEDLYLDFLNSRKLPSTNHPSLIATVYLKPGTNLVLKFKVTNATTNQIEMRYAQLPWVQGARLEILVLDRNRKPIPGIYGCSMPLPGDQNIPPLGSLEGEVDISYHFVGKRMRKKPLMVCWILKMQSRKPEAESVSSGVVIIPESLSLKAFGSSPAP
jgi:hypothetical protein